MEPVYTETQVEAWLQHIGLPKDFRPEHIRGRDLEALTRIVAYELSAVPFEDLELHYSKGHTISLDPQQLFHRIVNRGQGGYCMQANSFLEYMLRSLGFVVYSTGARSRRRENGVPTGPWTGWTHQVLIVTLADGHRYSVDVGYGGDCAIQPLRLEEGFEAPNLGQRNRIIREALGNDRSQKVWIYQIQYKPGGEWHSALSWGEAEFIPADFDVMSYFANTHESSWLVNTVMGVRFVRDGDEIIGKYTLAHATFKMNMRGAVQVVLRCKTEAERVAGLEKYFGVKLNAEEREAIVGWPSEIVGKEVPA